MTCECVIALVTCVATIITTVIAVLSYLKDKKELKYSRPSLTYWWRLFAKSGDNPMFGHFLSFNIPPTCIFVKSIKNQYFCFQHEPRAELTRHL